MAVAGTMLAHQVASKAVREAVFLSGPGIEHLPAIVIATAVAVVVAVPGFARLLAAWGPRRVVPVGFAVSAGLHVVELWLPAEHNAVSVVIYLHVAGLGALLLSGFWSLMSEIFDPRSAKESYGPIAAAGTIGGLAGGLAVLAVPVHLSLLVLAVLHGLCAAGCWVIGRRSPYSTLAEPEPVVGFLDWDVFRRVPHIATLALLVVLSTASAGIVDYLFKKEVAGIAGSRLELQRIFAIFYMGVGILTFWAQTGSGGMIRRFGLGRAIASLPAGLGVTTVVALVFPRFLPIVAARATEAVFRGSWFRSGYELLFVPMTPDDKRRVKTFLDVTCDRAGDAAGAAIVQGLIVVAIAAPAFAPFVPASLLVVTLAIVAAGFAVSKRIDGMYRKMVANRLADQASPDYVTIVSDTGWTVLDLPAELRPAVSSRSQMTQAPAPPAAPVDPAVQRLSDLRSGDRVRVESALRQMTRPERAEVAQAVQLLAWDDMVPVVRLTLERIAATHLGLFEDALTDRETDFAVRRRLPRIIAHVASDRSVAALTTGLEDPRFEVRYQCARALSRILRHSPQLSVDRERIMAAIERELSVPLQVWEGHRLLDAESGEDPDWQDPEYGTARRNLQHIFGLLGLVLPKEPLRAAFQGLQSADPELRALTLEYFEGVLPLSVVVRLYALPDFGRATESSGGAP